MRQLAGHALPVLMAICATALPGLSGCGTSLDVRGPEGQPWGLHLLAGAVWIWGVLYLIGRALAGRRRR